MLSQAFERSFFDPGHPLRWLDRCFNRYCFKQTVELNDRPLQIVWTRRAERQLQRQSDPLCVEMQLLFSCVVKKRVLFDSERQSPKCEVTPKLQVGFHAVASKACDPETFATDYPEGTDLSDTYAGRLSPTRLEIDFCQAEWKGQFHLG